MLPPEPPQADTISRSRTVLFASGGLLALIGIILSKAPLADFAGYGEDVGYLAASLFVMAAGLLSAGIVAHGRGYAPDVTAYLAALDETHATAGDVPWYSRLKRAVLGVWLHQAVADWSEVLVCVVFAAFAMQALTHAWRFENQPPPGQQTQQLFAGLLILLAFPFLLLERTFANMSSRTLPDAPRLERLSRVPLASLVGLGIARLLLSVGFEWASVIERAIAVIVGLVAMELILRGLAMLFLPFEPIGSRRAIADSTIASWLRLTVPSLSSVGTAVRNQFGIDLSRSWALAFVRRAALPIGLGMAALVWCLTGVTALGLDERAVYERLGVPVSVFGPGLHVHLPWPFGVVRPLELGVVHEIPIVASTSLEAGDRTDLARQTSSDADVEGPAPVTADRLWDEAHPSEASYLIASYTHGRQSFQIVNVDMRVVYRVGLTDAAAKQAVYAVADPRALIRAQAGRLLVRFFARHTLLDVLGQSRENVANEFHDELQNKLRELSTGIEIIAVVVEAIHPPAAAAGAYHNVHAAEILAQSRIALRRAGAIESMGLARQTATVVDTRAVAASAERVSEAREESVLFDGDEQANRRDGGVFLFERWLDRLASGLVKSNFILLDYRLKGVATPTIDLRDFAPPGSLSRDNPAEPNQSENGPGHNPAQPSDNQPAPDSDDR